ncbi:MAG: sucrase ferredoxin [Acidimicrobiales bacterium]|nr:sucrase ferredoxin [Acidimicrobiales bacterium]
MTSRTRCADEARARGEALLGTASTVRRWLLVEQPGAWGYDALTASELPAAVAGPLLAAARSAGVRVLLVRRPGRSRPSTRRLLLADSGPDGPWQRQASLKDVGDLAGLDLGAVFAAGGEGFGRPAPGPTFLVCTHGRHDPCCADFGRPLVRALKAAGVPRVWESSHLGGDRFAGNLLCLPHGLYFGRVAPEEGAAVVAAYRAGEIVLERYRGRSCFPMVVQAAEILARQELGIRGVDDLVPVAGGRRRLAPGEDAVTLRAADGRAWTVRVRTAPAGPPRLLTCRGPESTPPHYDLLSLTESIPDG